jgi:hypothetical protein
VALTGGIRAYARHRGTTHRAVQKARDDGRIQVVDGVIDFEAADRAWLANTDPAAQSLLYSAGPPGIALDAPAPAERMLAGVGTAASPQGTLIVDGDEPEPAAQTDLYRENRGERERIRREREQLELDQLRGSLIELPVAQQLAFTAFRSLRDAVLNVPARVKDQAAARTAAFEVEQLLEAELSAVFTRFDPAQLLADVRDEDDGED